MSVTIPGFMLMWVVPKVLRSLVRLMHAIGTRHRPAELESESNYDHEDEFFKHGANYKP